MAEPYLLYQRGVRKPQNEKNVHNEHESGKPHKPKKKANKDIPWTVQYRDPTTGKQILQRCTGQYSKTAAHTWAKAHMKAILDEYHEHTNNPLEKLLSEFYAPNSHYLARIESRTGAINESHRKHCHGRVRKYAIPFFSERGIYSIHDVDRALVRVFQDYLLDGEFPQKEGKEEKLKAKTINDIVSALKGIWNYLYDTGKVEKNPFDRLKQIKEVDNTKRGAFPLEKLQGVFDCEWKDKYHYIICLLAATTGIRNSEIEALTKSSIIIDNGVAFLDIQHAHDIYQPTKTVAGKRKIPLHPFVHEKLTAYIAEEKISDDSYLFREDNGKPIYYKEYNRAVKTCADLMMISAEYLIEHNISFYSFRHFYNSLLIDGNINKYKVDVLLGHALSRDMTANYYTTISSDYHDVLTEVEKVFLDIPQSLRIEGAFKNLGQVVK